MFIGKHFYHVESMLIIFEKELNKIVFNEKSLLELNFAP